MYHAVHMIFNGDFEDWDADEKRGNRLVFIGKNIDAAALRASFAECLATDTTREKQLKALRFTVGTRVECNMSNGKWLAGTVVDRMWRDEEMEQGQVCPYKVRLDMCLCSNAHMHMCIHSNHTSHLFAYKVCACRYSVVKYQTVMF